MLSKQVNIKSKKNQVFRQKMTSMLNNVLTERQKTTIRDMQRPAQNQFNTTDAKYNFDDRGP